MTMLRKKDGLLVDLADSCTRVLGFTRLFTSSAFGAVIRTDTPTGYELYFVWQISPLSAGSSFTYYTYPLYYIPNDLLVFNHTSCFFRIVGAVISDVDGTLYVEQSPDRVNWDLVSSFSVTGGTALGFDVRIVETYVRIRYVNGASPQSYMRLQWIVRPT